MAKKKSPPFRSLSQADKREQITWAAKWVFLEAGFDAASMDDVAGRAGTTKPTVYAHFATKEALFAAVVELVKGLYLEKLKDPAAYAEDPPEAVARFCGRFLELACWRDAVGFQRVALATAARSPDLTRAVYDTVYGEACRALAGYLKGQELVRHPEREAHLLLSAAAGGHVIRHLYGVDEPHPDLPDETRVGSHIDLAAIRAVVERLSAGWAR